MIRSIVHKGLKRLYEDDDARGVIAEHVDKLRDITARLDAARMIADTDIPGLRLHPLKGEMKGFWSGTTTDKGLNHAHEKSTPPRRFCISPVH
jgi:proteic killer suppression protein